MRLKVFLILSFVFLPTTIVSQDNSVSLAVDPVLQESGLTAFILPRFSLKTGIFVGVQSSTGGGSVPTDADLILTEDSETGSETAVPVISGFGQTFVIYSAQPGDASSTKVQSRQRLVDWLLSDVGKRTIEQFRLNGEQVFFARFESTQTPDAQVFDGDPNAGEALAYKVCGRCHVIGQRNRMKGLESTPSFALLRTFDDWQRRFESFFALNPHPSFSQVTGVTPPFVPTRPPPISPIILTSAQLEDIVAFVATVDPAKLGAPMVHQ